MGNVGQGPALNPDQDPDPATSNTESAVSRCSAQHVISANMLDAMRNPTATEEPEVLQTLAEEDSDDDDDVSSMDDDNLLQWAKRSAFPDNVLMRTRPARHTAAHILSTSPAQFTRLS